MHQSKRKLRDISAWQARRFSSLFAVFVTVAMVLWPARSFAQACSGPVGDCDGDGTPDSQETCPAGGAKTEYREGFYPIECFSPLLAQGYESGKLNSDSFGWDVCVPVAARIIRESIPVDHLHPASVTARTKINGVVFVGVLNPATTGSASVLASLHPASPQSVIAGFASGKVPRTALFTCVGSIQFADDGTLSKDPLWVYGYHFSASYVRAILEAGRAAGPKQFMDGIGVIRDVRENKAGWANGVAGTNGTLWDVSHWSTKPEVLQDKNIQAGDLPTYVDHFVDGTCYADLTDKLFGKFKDGMDVSPYPPLFLTLPDPAPDSYREWNGALTEKEYKDSADGKAALNRLSTFGLRPIQTNVQKVVIKSKSASVAAKSSIASYKPAKTNPSKTPKTPIGKTKPYGIVQTEFKEPGLVPFLEMSAPSAIDIPKTSCVPSATCVCEIDPALIWISGMELFMGQLSVIGDMKAVGWDFYFQDQTPSPWAVFRAIDQFSEAVGGDKKFSWNEAPSAGQLHGSNLIPAFRPAWNMRKPIGAGLPSFDTVSTRKQLNVPPNATVGFKFPYGNGVLLKAPNDLSTDWLLATGATYSALVALQATSRGIADFWHTKTGNLTTLSVSLESQGSFQSTSSTGWQSSTVVWGPQMMDYAEVTMADALWSPGTPYDFKSVGAQVSAAKHLTADSWHPGADQWVTNFGNSKAFVDTSRIAPATVAGFAPNPQDQSILDWAPSDFSTNPSVASYDYRVKTKCSSQTYNPYDADYHWPRVATSRAMAGLYGKEEIGAPRAHFAGDLMWRPLTGAAYGSRMHEGLDINWSYTEKYIDPQYRGILGSIPDQYCYGMPEWMDYKIPLGIGKVGSFEVPIPCDNDDMVACGSEADEPDGCNPLQRIAKKIEAECNTNYTRDCNDTDVCGTIKDFCSAVFLGWLCEAGCDVAACTGAVIADIASCIGSLLEAPINFFKGYFLQPICTAITGQQCASLGDWDMTFYRKNDGANHHEIEVELEHRIGFGNFTGENMCQNYIKGECSTEDYQLRNSIYRGDPPTPVQDSNGCKNVVSIQEDFTPGGAYNLKECGFKFTEPVNPRVLAPGAMAHPGAWAQRVATYMGHAGADFNSDLNSVALLPETARTQYSALANKDINAFPGFRLEFVGDVILDCGHSPLRTEIHPPTNVLMHLSAPKMVETKRYSLFAWRRNGSGAVEPAQFDLWPGLRPKGAKVPFVHILPPIVSSSAMSCVPYPTNSPNRIRCTLGDSGVSGNSDECEDNVRMRPSCTQDVGGGLLEVGWAK